MKLSSLYSWTILAGCAVAEEAYVWAIDHGAPRYATTKASLIRSETASYIIARRRAFANDEHLTTMDENLKNDYDQYGGHQMPMYGTTSETLPAKILIRITGYSGTASQFSSLPDLWIEDATKDLATEFKASQNVAGICEYDLSIPTKDGVDMVYAYDPEGSSCMSTQQLKMQPTILALMSTVPTANEVATKMNGLLRTLNHLSVTANLESTLLVLPPLSKLHKAKSGRRADPSEKPLEIEVKTSTSTSATASASATKPAGKKHPLPSIIPQCFSSQESCDNSTNACSGHGSCYKAHTNCYKCRCGRTVVRENKDGSKKTVQWGGNACQKKDISIEFVLFASLGVIFAALIAGSIGAMYTMGSQELPSVIGAGVAGPKQK